MSATLAIGPATVELPDPLPPLREELQLHPAGKDRDGSPAWTIQDPVRNAFYRIGWLAFELLSRWSEGSPANVLRAVGRETPLAPSQEELGELYAFLLQNELLAIHHPGYTRKLLDKRRAVLPGARWLLHHYLFFRVPLVRPAEALRRMLPWLSWIYSRRFALLVLSVTFVGVLLTARQWDVFLSGFQASLSAEGLVGYLVALAITKSLHELGHALTATRFGLRVGHMGVAFVVMWPMLYTDTGEAWRLADRRKRLAIASAGIVTELAIAGVATLLWNLAADDSAMKEACFFLASTAWILSLTFNASPFMRFDGYFILSDLLDLPNLHERAGALAITALRNTLLGWNDPAPESFPPAQRRALICFAYVTWFYRLVVFIGIAVAVYLFFFKLLGILLFIVEIAWFVLRPVWAELRIWRGRWREVPNLRKRLGMAILAGLVLLAVIPWQSSISAPAWIHPSQMQAIYSPLPARIVSMAATEGSATRGSLLFELEQPEIGFRQQVSDAARDAVSGELRGLGVAASMQSRRAALLQEQAMREAQMLAQEDEAERLRLTAGFDGVLMDIDPELGTGVWVNPRQPLALLVNTDEWVAEAFVGQADLDRLKKGNAVKAYLNLDARAGMVGEVVDIAAARTTLLPHVLLSSARGGAISVLSDAEGMTPREGLYRVRIRLEGTPPAFRMFAGRVLIEGEARGWLQRTMKPIIVTLYRELGF